MEHVSSNMKIQYSIKPEMLTSSSCTTFMALPQALN